MDEQRLRRLKMYFPSLVEKAVEFIEYEHDIIIKCNDGSSVLFDEETGTTRILPRDSNNMSDEEISREFVFRLRQALYRKNMTQDDLSRVTGIPQYLISNYINGKTSPSFRNVDKIARALGCSTDDLRYID